MHMHISMSMRMYVYTHARARAHTHTHTQGDAAAADNKILDRAWRGVEAMELLLETHAKLYAGDECIDAAMKCALALADYEDILDPETVLAMLHACVCVITPYVYTFMYYLYVYVYLCVCVYIYLYI